MLQHIDYTFVGTDNYYKVHETFANLNVIVDMSEGNIVCMDDMSDMVQELLSQISS